MVNRNLPDKGRQPRNRGGTRAPQVSGPAATAPVAPTTTAQPRPSVRAPGATTPAVTTPAARPQPISPVSGNQQPQDITDQDAADVRAATARANELALADGPIGTQGPIEGPTGGGGAATAQLAGLLDPDVFRSVTDSITAQGGTIIAAETAPDGSVVVTWSDLDGNPQQTVIDAQIASGGLALDAKQLELNQQDLELRQRQQTLDETFRRDQLRIQQEMARIDQEIEVAKAQVDAQIRQGELALALETQNRIDQREAASRQLERDLANANLQYQRQVLDLDRSRFDLERQKFLAELSQQPGNYFDFFNISRGLPTAGLGGPLPEGISRAVGLNPTQQANAGQVIQVPGLPDFGAVPQLGAEAAVPTSQFDLSQFFDNLPNFGDILGGSPQPGPGSIAAASGLPYSQQQDLLDALNGTGVTDQASSPAVPAASPAAPAGTSAQPAAAVGAAVGNPFATPLPSPDTGLSFGDFPGNLAAANTAATPAGRTAPAAPLGATTGNPADQLGIGSIGTAIQEIMNTATGAAKAQQSAEGFFSPPGSAATQRAQLPPELAAVFGGGQASDAGVSQLPNTGVPFLSPQQLLGLSPAARELYVALQRMIGLRPEDFQFIADQRLPGQRQVSRQVA